MNLWLRSEWVEKFFAEGSDRQNDWSRFVQRSLHGSPSELRALLSGLPSESLRKHTLSGNISKVGAASGEAHWPAHSHLPSPALPGAGSMGLQRSRAKLSAFVQRFINLVPLLNRSAPLIDGNLGGRPLSVKHPIAGNGTCHSFGRRGTTSRGRRNEFHAPAALKIGIPTPKTKPGVTAFTLARLFSSALTRAIPKGGNL